MNIFTPQQTSQATGVSPETLRDWRRRGLLDRVGVIPLPSGKLTDNPEHPDLAEVGRVTWAYLRGDLIVLAVAQRLAALGLDLAASLTIAAYAAPRVDAYLDPRGSPKLRQHAWLVAWPSVEGSNAMGAAIGEPTIMTFADLNRVAKFSGPAAIILDLPKLAAEMPTSLTEALGYK